MPRLQPANGDFDEKSQLLHRYVIPKLNKKLLDATMDIDDQNGFEVLRLVMDKAVNIECRVHLEDRNDQHRPEEGHEVNFLPER